MVELLEKYAKGTTWLCVVPNDTSCAVIAHVGLYKKGIHYERTLQCVSRQI